MTIHKQGYPTLFVGFIVLSFLNSLVYYFFNPFSIYFLVLTIGFYLFLISFFRNPQRIIPELDDKYLYSPCDGKVVVIEKVFEPEFIKEECIQISVFMSPLNVHINWFPTSAQVLYYKYHPGKYLAAWNPKASTENERTTIAYNVHNKKVLLRQVAGALARRIVCFAKEGKTYKQGEEMGFIKFGSRVDIYLKPGTDIKVKLGDVVKGNQTILALI